jgi:lipoprotein-anchoring transpeptidase ErfK/SrfK
VTLDDRLLYQARVGLGRDNTTPVGEFSIEVRLKNPTWFRPGSEPIEPGDPRNVLGSRWLGFRDTEQISGIGIHGTVDADSIGRESSAGCIRMLKEDVEMVFDLVPHSTTVVITP